MGHAPVLIGSSNADVGMATGIGIVSPPRFDGDLMYSIKARK